MDYSKVEFQTPAMQYAGCLPFAGCGAHLRNGGGMARDRIRLVAQVATVAQIAEYTSGCTAYDCTACCSKFLPDESNIFLKAEAPLSAAKDEIWKREVKEEIIER